MTEETTVIHNRIPLELDEFIENTAKNIPEFYNKTHVVIYAIQQLKETLAGPEVVKQFMEQHIKIQTEGESH